MPPGDLTLVDQVLRLGVPGLLLLIIVTGAKENPWWVFGNAHRRELAREQAERERERVEKEEWKAIALSNLHMVEEGLDIATAGTKRRATDRRPP